MKKIIFESFQDIETFLRSSEIISRLTDKFNDLSSADSQEVCDEVLNELSYEEDSSVNAKVEKVVVCKVLGEEVDLIDQSHYVVNFNGYYYDYTAQTYNDSFSGMIRISSLPVVQPIIHSDNQINDKLSTIKGYVLLGY